MNKKFNEWLQYEEHYINGKISCMTRDAEYIENLKDIKKANIEYDFFRNKNITVIEYILKMMDIDYNSFKIDKVKYHHPLKQGLKHIWFVFR